MLIKIVNIIKRKQTPVDIIHWDINNCQSSISIDEKCIVSQNKETVRLISLSLRNDMQTCTYSKFVYKFINRFLQENGAKNSSKHLLCTVYFYYIDYKESIFMYRKTDDCFSIYI